MRWYRIANLPIASAVALPAVPCAGGGSRAWRFVLDRRGVPPKPAVWYHHERSPDGRRRRSLARDGDRDVIRFGRSAVFVVSFAERLITGYALPATPIDTVRQLLVGQVLPVVFAGRGALALHASAVCVPRGAIVFVGETRRGKSTVAAALGARGCPLVADDCAIVEIGRGHCRVRPMHVGLRLWPDALGLFGRSGTTSGRACSYRKTRVHADSLDIELQDRPAPLHRVYLLEPGPGLRSAAIEAVSPADALVAMLAASFQLGLDRPAELRRSFEKLSAVAACVPVRRLRRPRGLQHLPLLVEQVMADAAERTEGDGDNGITRRNGETEVPR